MTQDTRTGAKLKTLRESLGLSVEQLAERSGCDVVVIEQLEAGAIAPSLAPLITITRALGCRLGTLLDDDTNLGPVLTRASDLQSVERVKSLETGTEKGGHLEFFTLAAGKTSRHIEPFVIAITPGAERSLSTHEGEELIHVLDGAVAIEYGKETYELGVGDTLYYDSIVPHQVRAAAGVPARILAVVWAPF